MSSQGAALMILHMIYIYIYVSRTKTRDNISLITINSRKTLFVVCSYFISDFLDREADIYILWRCRLSLLYVILLSGIHFQYNLFCYTRNAAYVNLSVVIIWST